MRRIKMVHTAARTVLFLGPREGRALRLWLRHLLAGPEPQPSLEARGRRACGREWESLKNNLPAYRPRQEAGWGLGY